MLVLSRGIKYPATTLSTWQGTNAHVLLDAPSGTALDTEAILPPIPWQRQRVWVSPAAHPWLTVASIGSSSRAASFHAYLSPSWSFADSSFEGGSILLPGIVIGLASAALMVLRPYATPTNAGRTGLRSISLPTTFDSLATSIEVGVDFLTATVNVAAAGRNDVALLAGAMQQIGPWRGKSCKRVDPDYDLSCRKGSPILPELLLHGVVEEALPVNLTCHLAQSGKQDSSACTSWRTLDTLVALGQPGHCPHGLTALDALLPEELAGDTSSWASMQAGLDAATLPGCRLRGGCSEPLVRGGQDSLSELLYTTEWSPVDWPQDRYGGEISGSHRVSSPHPAHMYVLNPTLPAAVITLLAGWRSPSHKTLLEIMQHLP